MGAAHENARRAVASMGARVRIGIVWETGIDGVRSDGVRRRAALNLDKRSAPRVRLRRLALSLVAGVAVVLLLATGRAWAAVELAYFRGAPTESSVLLEWATVSEFNVSGFEILCKLESEPETAYHPIGSRIGQGSPDQGASYSFNVTALTYGVRYCFRLREVTADNVPGEQFDICGYGPGVGPPALNVVGEVTPTPIILQAQPGISPAPTLTTPGVILPDGAAQTPALPTPQGQDQFGSPLDLPTLTPSLLPEQQGVSPLPTATLMPGQFESALPTPMGQQPGAGVAGIDVTPAGEAPGTLIGGAQVTVETTTFATETPTATWVPTETPIPFETPTLPPLQESPLMPGAGSGVALLATPTPLYVVVTATPTPEALAAVPVFTPWPTATPPGFQASDLLALNSQNLMVMLLCLIFLSASGLGVLGLVTSIIYMRSQAARDRLPAPYYERRRYY